MTIFSAFTRRRTAAVAGAALALALIPVGGAAQAATPTASITLAHPHVHSLKPHLTRTEHLHGTKGTLTFDVTVPVFTGTKAAPKIDHELRAAAWKTINATAKEPGSDTKHELTGRAHVTTNDGRTVQVTTEYADYFTGAAHPTDTVETAALTARTGSPIPLGAVFTHEKRALTILGRLVEKIAEKSHQPVTDKSGLAPTAGNWSTWQTTGHGFVAHFQDYQLGGHGLRSYTIPWHDVIPLLTKHAKALVAPKH